MDRPDDDLTALWVVRVPGTPDARHLSLLTAAERSACDRLGNAALRARRACGRALARTVLGSMCGQAPKAVTLAPGENGRPGLIGESAARAPDLDFNASSTPGLTAFAVTRAGRVGVDLERPSNAGKDPAFRSRWLSVAEQAWLEETDTPKDGFHRLWTSKEAVAKALGAGLGLSFTAFTVVPSPDGRLVPRFDGALDTGAPWRLWNLAADDVPVALALQGSAGPSRLRLDLSLNGPVFEPVSLRIRAGPEGAETP